MKEKQSSVIDLLFPENVCYQIPPFQRNYQWDIPQIHRLAHDISQSTFEVPPHWIGITLVGTSSRICELGGKLNHHCRDVLDGQQRLITLRLWCTALIDEFIRQTGKNPKVSLVGKPDSEFERETFMNIQVHALDTAGWGEIKSKKVSFRTTFDKSDSSSIARAYLYFRFLLLSGLNSLISDDELRVPENKDETLTVLDYWLSLDEIDPIGQDDILDLLQKTLERLSISVLEHENGDEDIEVIFETLNSARVELGQFDLFRNYLLIKSSQQFNLQKSLYTETLQVGEKNIQSAVLNIRKRPLDRFLYDFLISQLIFEGTLKADGTAREFKKYWDEKSSDEKDVKQYIESVLIKSMNAWLAAISAGDIKKSGINLSVEICRTLMRIENLSRGPFTPLTTRIIYESQLNAPQNQKLLLQELKLVEAFAARSLLAGEAFSPLRRQIMSACLQIFNSNSNEKISLKDWVIENSPSDERIRKVLTQSVAKNVKGKLVEVEVSDWVKTRDLYQRAEPRQIRAILDAIVEKMDGKQTNPVVTPPTRKITKKDEVWVEHLFPQDNSEWIDNLKNWKTSAERMARRLHSIGNLTVLPMKENIQLGKKNLKDKQSGFIALPIQQFKLTKGFLNSTKWTEVEIDARTMEMTELCLEIWKLPE
jgi:uncharacterized protein with ParB-like and HNH nuclease domain